MRDPFLVFFLQFTHFVRGALVVSAFGEFMRPNEQEFGVLDEMLWLNRAPAQAVEFLDYPTNGNSSVSRCLIDRITI